MKDIHQITALLTETVITLYRHELKELAKLHNMELDLQDHKYLEILMINTDELLTRIITNYIDIVRAYDGDEDRAKDAIDKSLRSECEHLAAKALGIEDMNNKTSYVANLIMDTYLQCIVELEHKYGIPHSEGADEEIIIGVFQNNIESIIHQLRFDTENTGDPRGIRKSEFRKRVHKYCLRVAKLALHIGVD